MSRCFPYPPPGYCRNGATSDSLIESIKLQKETDKSKAERKKEKRAKKEEKKEKKRKEKTNNEEKVKLQKNPNEHQLDSHKALQKSAEFKEGHTKKTEPNTEQLERSDLSEEHGQPISLHKPSYSSDNSTQNSNKRKRDDAAVLPEVPTGHGKPIKIRLLKKHKGPDSVKETDPSVPFTPSLVKETLVSNSRNTDVPATSGRFENNAVTRNTSVPASSGRVENNAVTRNSSVPATSGRVEINAVTRNTGVPATSGRVDNAVTRNAGVPATSGRVENNAVTRNAGLPATSGRVENNAVNRAETRNNDPNRLHTVRNAERPMIPSTHVKDQIPHSHVNKNEVPVASRSRNGDVEMLHSSRQPQMPNYGRPVLAERRVGHDIAGPSSVVPPAPSVSRKIDTQGFQLVANKTEPSASRKRSINELNLPANSGPTNGPARPEKKKEPVVEVPQKVGPTRHEKKLMKKHSKYEKLIGSWVPPVLEAQLPNYNDDEDWLSRRVKPVKSSVGNDVEMCREPAGVSSLWQPCARFLVEADVYAMPYTVPF